MALPKRKKSRSKSRKRRTHYKVSVPGQSLCPSCGEKKPPTGYVRAVVSTRAERSVSRKRRAGKKPNNSESIIKQINV